MAAAKIYTVTLAIKVPVLLEHYELAYGNEPGPGEVVELVEGLVKDALDTLINRHDVVCAYQMGVSKMRVDG